MTVAQNLSTGQNESAPGVGITEGGKLYELPQVRLKIGNRRWSYFQHASGLSARGMPA